MKLKLIAALILTLGTGVRAQVETQNPVIIGVLNIAGPRRTLANNITALLEVNLSSDARFAVVNRSELNKVLSEQALGKAGYIAPETAARIGRLTGAKILVTGREFSPDSNNNIVVMASVIGAETGRVFSQSTQGNATNLVDLISELSQQIKQTIMEQSTNLLVAKVDSLEQRLAQVIQKIKVKSQPAVLIKINEFPALAAHQIVQNELVLIFQKAGFTVLNERSRHRPDILITGDAITTDDSQKASLFSGHATLEVKAQERTTGKILALDLQQGVAVDIARQIASDMALKNAADALAERLLPALAR